MASTWSVPGRRRAQGCRAPGRPAGPPCASRARGREALAQVVDKVDAGRVEVVDLGAAEHRGELVAPRLVPRAVPAARVAYEHAGVALHCSCVSSSVVMRCSGVAIVAFPPAEPDICRRAGLVLATQRHIIRAGEALPSAHTVSGMVARPAGCGMVARWWSSALRHVWWTGRPGTEPAGPADVEVDAAGHAGDAEESTDLPDRPVVSAGPAKEARLPQAAVDMVPDALLRLEVVPDMTGNVAQVFLTESKWTATLQDIRAACATVATSCSRRGARNAAPGRSGPSIPAPSSWIFRGSESSSSAGKSRRCRCRTSRSATPTRSPRTGFA